MRLFAWVVFKVSYTRLASVYEVKTLRQTLLCVWEEVYMYTYTI